ncbi:MAG: MFS transporter [Gammaproteobacteria bacterium]|nr:MFS transporter [Gammaproteobacteria bacterium]MBU6509882.1 MFS transporter [Gammaproteobacteria bacterium]MDE1984214.1 MFS transporter [Gammaproteobacteria bacterium]MDE2108484.1 MFS transporter [Gammaproteobacteria bacterium]MDE2460782.1 MFS transporter [Gammaproteobacteria bacterium]
MPLLKNRKLWGWASYYWGNHAYTTSIITVFFPIFFLNYWDHGTSVSVNTFRLGLANSIASLVVALSAPVLGAIADRGGHKKRFLITTAFLGALMVLALHFVGMGQWQWAWLFYVIASMCYWWGNVFGDSMLVSVAEPGKLDMTSAIGYFAGYLGGGLFLIVGVALSLKPQWFGLADAAAAVKIILILTAIWWLAFSLPLLFWVPEPNKPAAKQKLLATAKAGLLQLVETFRHVRSYKPVFMFLIAYWVYIDGVNTIIQMAVDYGKAIGFTTTDLILAVLMVQFIGVPAALLFGRLGERIGPKIAIFMGLAVYVFVTVFAAFMQHSWQFFVLAGLVGLVQGGVQLLSRSYYARLVPVERAGEFFGFYNMLGEFAAIIGPFLIGLVSILTGSPRLSILSVILLFLVGAALLALVKTESTGTTGAVRGSAG